tara:strand:+ start:9735 stop:10283 length:549 start_codon:yes stop_codon:yes gene_type:complete
MNKLFTIISLLAVFSTSLLAEEKRIVVGAQSEPDGSTYEVGFCAREKDEHGSDPGHAFVVLQSFDKDKKRTDFLTAGFRPPKSKPLHGYGLISPEKYSDPTQKCLIAQTNKEKYQEVKTKIETQTTYSFGEVSISLTETYVVLFKDCVTFMQAVAEGFGLKVPTRFEGIMPLSFVDALINDN